MCSDCKVLMVLVALYSCNEKQLNLELVSYVQFELFDSETNYVTDAEKYGWSIVQKDVYNYEVVEGATWLKPDGINEVASGDLPVTQVSYNDAKAYCKWAHKKLPSYEEYWELVEDDTRVVIFDNMFPISDLSKVNAIGNVWEITELQKNASVRLAGGSLFCSGNTCNGTIKERELYVDSITGNIHIGFGVIDL